MSSEISSPGLLTPYEIIFSCSICQKTISELYRRPRTDHGFSSNGEERVVTRLWLTRCGHLTCSDHLEGGGLQFRQRDEDDTDKKAGVPFHPQGQQPAAPCPQCLEDKNDSTPRPMYAIHGPHLDEHDKLIPKEYFEVPPEELNNKKNAQMNALRFQWLSMLRFAGRMEQRCREASHGKKIAEAKVQDLATSLQETRKEAGELRAEVGNLRITEGKYNKYKKREPEIRHYLENFATIARENTQMKQQLISLGYKVPETQYSLPGKDGVEASGQLVQHHQHHNPAHQNESSSSGKKRTREDYLEGTVDNHFDPPVVTPARMPPPPLPRASRTSKQGVEMYSGGAWRHAQTSDEDNPLPAHSSPPGLGQYMMSGALRPDYGSAQQISTKTHRQIGPPQRHPQAPNWRSSSLQPPDEDPMRFAEYQGLSDSQYLSDRDHLQYQQAPNPSPAFRQQMQQPLLPVRGQARPLQRQSAAHNNVNGHTSGRSLPTRDSVVAPAVQPISHSMTKAMESPFFHPKARPAHQTTTTPMKTNAMHHENLVTSMEGMRMDIDQETPPKTRSLNALSFIQEPYSQSNKPVYSRPASRLPWSRLDMSGQDQQFPMQPGQPRSYIPDPRVATERTPMAPPPSTTRTVGRTHPRAEQMPLASFRGVKGSGPMGSSYNGQMGGGASTMHRFPYQQQRGLLTASGRRSVRR